MFWGLLLEPGKRYSTTVDKSFHVSKAALDCSSIRNDNEILSVILETEGSEALLCNLSKQKGILQESLDLNFMAGDRVTFECRGHGRIHLTGYLLPDEEDEMSGYLGEESEEEDESAISENSPKNSPETKKKGKRKSENTIEKPSKKVKAELDEDEDNGLDDSDEDDDSDMSDDDESIGDEDLDDEESDREDDDESEEEKEVPLGKKNKPKQQQQKQEKNKTPSKQTLDTSLKKTPLTNGVPGKEQKSNKKTPSGEKSSPSANNSLNLKQKKVLDMGVVVKEVRVGSGAPAKPGKTVGVHYIGKLRDSNKVFDKQMKGEPFKFKLGKGEVIKGWDIGLQGMRVGGKRIVHCPPEAAYGAKGVPPKIPSNSTLIFEVELKNVI